MLSEASTSTPSRLVLEATLEGVSPETVTDNFTDPDLVTAWWAEQAHIDADSGDYVFGWPEMEWTLRGKFTEIVRGRRVRFTWHWDHEPLHAVRSVLITTGTVDGGTHLTITHGDYAPDDTEERNGHIEGWTHFIGKLADRVA